MIGYVGYAKLRPGRIHLYCPTCGRKQSNAHRMTTPVPDPESAVLIHVHCERCSVGSKDGGVTFYDAKGRNVCGFCGRARCERAEGRWHCDERLLEERNGQ